jgi:hypothetical protein
MGIRVSTLPSSMLKQTYQPSAFLTMVAVLSVNPRAIVRCTITGISPILGISNVVPVKKQAAFG